MLRLLPLLPAALAALTAGVHIFVGTFDTLLPVTSGTLPLMVRGTMAACWHILGLFLAVSAWVFARDGAARICLAWLWIGGGVIFVVTALWMGGLSALLILPQWILLLPTGLAALWLRGVPHHHPSGQGT
ncbi:hypothetical protein [Sagittula sp. SSi028]|uniref:hypothetical protein n=1 Tax=Sagittula sp. SSi028 TaxID=3400636 RepID=UPI003AF63BE4